MQGIGAGKAEHRMIYTALLYTPDKKHTHYLVDFEPDALASKMRSGAGVGRRRGRRHHEFCDHRRRHTAGGGVAASLGREPSDDPGPGITPPSNLCDFAKVWPAGRGGCGRAIGRTRPRAHTTRTRGEALLTSLQALALPAEASADAGGAAEADRLLHEQPPSHGLPELPA